MSDLRELYQQVILDHNRRPRNYRKLEHANRTAEGVNPLCGDHITVYLALEGDVIADIGFQGSGCAIDRAAASMMTDSLKGRTIADAERLFEGFHRMLTNDGNGSATVEGLGKLAVFAGVSEFPSRIKCATLPWHAVRAALAGKTDAVSTE